MIKIGIFGDTGVVGSEIGRILKHHPSADVVYRKNSEREEGSLGDCELVFLALKDEDSLREVPQLLRAGKRIIDMSVAFRLNKEAVYGLPAVFRKQIREAKLVANPGCYATVFILTMKPLESYVKGPLSVNAISGRSGSRKEVLDASNQVTYNWGTNHKHVPEMEKYAEIKVRNFSPIVSESVSKGINMNIEFPLSEDLDGSDAEKAERLRAAIVDAYEDEDLIKVVLDTNDKKYGDGDVNDTHFVLINKVRKSII